MLRKKELKRVVGDFTKAMKVLTWKTITIDCRQCLKIPLVEMSTFKFAFNKPKHTKIGQAIPLTQ